MTPVELLPLNPGIIQRLVDMQEYTLSQANRPKIETFLREVGFPVSEVANILREMDMITEEASREIYPEIPVVIGGDQFSSRIGLYDIWFTQNSHKSRVISSTIDETLNLNSDRKCMYLDCDGSFYYNPVNSAHASAVHVYRITNMTELAATVDTIFYSINDNPPASPCLLIVDGLTTLLHQSDHEKSYRNRILVSHFMATCDRMSQTFGMAVLLCNQFDNYHYRNIIKQYLHSSIHIYHKLVTLYSILTLKSSHSYQ